MPADSDKLKQVFMRYDRNGDGAISCEELKVLLKALGTFKESEIDTVFQHMDANKDGSIQYDEFVDWISCPGGRGVDVKAKAALAPTSDDGLSVVFYGFCGTGHQDMDGKGFAKLCKDCQLLDRRLTPTDVDLIFAKVLPKGRRRIDLTQFQATLPMLSDKKGTTVDGVVDKVVESGGPRHAGTASERVRLHDDHSTYTGVHGRSDESPAPPSRRGGGSPSESTGSRSLPMAEVRRGGGGSPTGGTGSRSMGMSEVRTLGCGYTSHEAAFRNFCGGSADMDGRSFAKLCRDCGLLDRKFTPSDADIIFTQVVPKGQRRISFKQFEDALWKISEKKSMDYSAVLACITKSSGPVITATFAEDVRLHDDKTTYTGSRAWGAD